MTPNRLLRHHSGAPGLRWLGLGPACRPTRGLINLQRLLNKHAFWAKDRSLSELKALLRQSRGGESVTGQAPRGLWQGPQ